MNEHLPANQRWWVEAVPIHAASAFYDVDGYYRLPGDDSRFPFMFSLRARKPL